MYFRGLDGKNPQISYNGLVKGVRPNPIGKGDGGTAADLHMGVRTTHMLSCGSL